jgi:tetratricopeptide (TPR) repeat protein
MPEPSQKTTGTITALAPWLYGPWLDLIVGCGAWSAPLLLFSYFSLASSARLWAVGFYALALVFNYPHYMATLYRAYHRAEDFQKYRIFTVHITALVMLTLLLSHVWFRALPWIFTIYLTWSPWHYSGQNYGLFTMFVRRAGVELRTSERRSMYGAFVVSYLILFLGFHTGRSNDPLFVSLGIPHLISKWEQLGLGLLFVVLAAFGLRGPFRAAGWRKLAPALTLFSTQILWFLVPAAASLVRGLEIPQNRYSSGVLAVMHSAQYLWITSYYARRENAEGDGRGWRPMAYFAILVAGGIALFVPGPWLASRIFHYDFTSSFLIFTALVNIHHFILDGAIWKLRDGRIAALLLNSKARFADTAAEATGRTASSWRWLVGVSSGARALRVAAALILLMWGGVDQVRYYLALHSDDLRDLERAAVLDSFDAPLQMRLARKEMDNGQPKEAESALRRALQINPANPAARHSMLRYLIEQKRFDEAYAFTETSLEYAPKDVNLLVDRGILAKQFGRSEEAVASWKKAADLEHVNASLYLADEFDREGKPKDAIPYYRKFLQQIARQGRENRPAPGKTIAIVLRMAECQVRAGQADDAVKSYHLAGMIAAQTKEGKLESVADVNEAALQGKAGKLHDALHLYQNALQLDEAAGDRRATAEDWFAYGRLLEDNGFPRRYAYACFLKSQSLTQSLSASSVPPALTEAIRRAATKAGPEAAKIRRNPEPVAAESVSLRR